MAYPFAAAEVLTAANLNAMIGAPTQNNQTGTTYTLALLDAGKTVTLSNAAAVAVTLPAQATVAWVANCQINLLNLGAGTVTIAGAVGVTINGTPLTLATSKGGSLIRTASNTWTFVPLGSGGSAAGAAITDTPTGNYASGGVTYDYWTYNSSGTLNVSTAGFADVLCVGGGGGGGGTLLTNVPARGAGAGGYISQSIYLPTGNHAITIGAGGSAGTNANPPLNGRRGSNSSLPFGITAIGGGPGLSGGSPNNDQQNLFGGSGGGQGLGAAGQGNNGGTTQGGSANFGSSGGGGAGGTGGDGTNTTGGAGGAGVSSSITGSAVGRGGGGGGTVLFGGTTGTATSGGGAGGAPAGAGNAGTANTGGGGGAGSEASNGGAGGSGVVIVRVARPYTPVDGQASIGNTATGTYSVGPATYSYFTFNSSSTLTVNVAGLATVLCVGGGGAGGHNNAGGGGAGGHLFANNVFLSAGTKTITVGAGGAASSPSSGPGNNGIASRLDFVYSPGGGGGGGVSGGVGAPGLNGASGGGGAVGFSAGGAGVAGLGNNGSTEVGVGAGGGGAGSTSGNGNGGAGLANSITGTSVTRAGGGASYTGTGGSGGGGNPSTAGTANTGGGGGGLITTSAGAGGSGVVIVLVRTA